MPPADGQPRRALARTSSTNRRMLPATAPPWTVHHLIKGLGRGGAESLLPQTIRAGGSDFRYGVGYLLPSKDALAAEIAAAGATVRCFGARSSAGLLLQIPRIARWLKSTGADLVHAHLPLTGAAARIAGRLAAVPVIYTEHNLQERYHPLTRRANGWTWRWQARVVAVSEEVAGSIRRNLGEEVPLSVVRNGIEMAAAVPSAAALPVKRRFGIPDDAPVVGTVAVLRTQKRFDLWLEAARGIRERRPDVYFLIVGDGPLRKEMEARAADLGISPQLRFAGIQTDVPPFLASFDVFLMSSQYEGLPLALLEAMAARVPVVATAVGGIPEVVESGRTGVLVPFGDAAALGGEVVRLLDEPERRRSLAAAARRRVEEEFGIGRMARELEQLYREILTGVRP